MYVSEQHLEELFSPKKDKTIIIHVKNSSKKRGPNLNGPSRPFIILGI